MQMKELIQQKMWVYNRGVELLLPPEARPLAARSESSDPTSIQESERLRQIAKDGTLKRRYPNPEAGQEFMESVCFARRSELLQLAGEASNFIQQEWDRISDKPIAIVLFGSIAKGLVKQSDHRDPSNVDLTVIGDITQSESTLLYDNIRPYRKEIQKKIFETCERTDSQNEDSANLGVSIQHISKLSNGHFSGISSYLGSGAFPLRDDGGIWKRIESEALSKFAEEVNHKKYLPYVKSKEWKNAELKAELTSAKIIDEKKSRDSECVVFEQKKLF